MNNQAVSTSILNSISESTSLEEIEGMIEQSVNFAEANFRDAGILMKHVRDTKMYLKKSPTFELYCETRWNRSRSYVYRLMDSAVIAQECVAIGDIPNEHAARALSKLPKKDRIPTLKKVLASHQTITAKSIAAAQPQNQPETPIQFPPAAPPDFPSIIRSWRSTYTPPTPHHPPSLDFAIKSLMDFIQDLSEA